MKSRDCHFNDCYKIHIKEESLKIEQNYYHIYFEQYDLKVFVLHFQTNSVFILERYDKKITGNEYGFLTEVINRKCL
jgi:hypothetical protein